jgi:hypothetical protein
VLDSQLAMHSVDLIDLIFEFEAQGNLLVKGLFGLLVVLHQHVLIVLQVLILIPK